MKNITAENMRQAQSYMTDKKTREWLEKQRVLREVELENLEGRILETAASGRCSNLLYKTHWGMLGDDFREITLEMLTDNGFTVTSPSPGHILISWTENDRTV
jgi:hypothetical protein